MSDVLESGNRRGILFVFSGPSGSGKDTILAQYFKNPSDTTFLSVSVTTRAPRDGEVHGKDYYFISHTEMNELIKNDGLIEYAEYCGNYYGTPKQAVVEHLNKGHDVILEIETQGAMSIKNIMQDAVLIFLQPPSIEVLRQRLTKRMTESEEQVNARVSVAEHEMKFRDMYDYVIVNDTIENSVKQLENAMQDAQKTKNK